MTTHRFLPYVWKTVTRARVRSLLTVIGTALALALFAFVRTLEHGVDALNSSAGSPVLVVFQQSRFCPLTSELPMRYRKDVESIDGVEAVLPTLLYINACRSNLDLVTLNGVDPETLLRIQDLKAVEGDLESWKSVANGALVGSRLAARRHIRLGDRTRFVVPGGGAIDLDVRGIVEGAGAGLDNIAFVHLDQLQRARSLQGKASEMLVRLKPGADANAIARQIDAKFKIDEAPTDTKTMQAFVQGAVGEISELVSFGRLLGYMAVLVVVLILGNTVFISAQTRAGELGVLETVGLTKGSLAALLTAESLALAIVGGILGTLAVVAWFAFRPLTLGIEGYGIDFVAGMPVVIAGLVASVVVGLAAAVGPAVEALTRPLSLAVRPA